MGNLLEELTAAISTPAELRRIIFSGRRKGFSPDVQRIDIRPITLKGTLHLQVVSHDGRQDTTKNFEIGTLDLASLVDAGFANILIETNSMKIETRISKKGTVHIHRERIERDARPLSDDFVGQHDRRKQRLLAPDEAIFFELGISNREGQVLPSRTDKYIQVDQFLRILEPLLSKIDLSKRIRVVDLGCGHAYLTFATFQYLANRGIDVEVLGVDVRADSIDRNRSIARKLGIDQNVTFLQSSIKELEPTPSDIVIALHACDTATDDALTWAIKSGTSIILSAPCCHHDLNAQITKVPAPWQILTRHGIVKERIADNLTDAIRAQVLRILGFSADIIEFIGGEHTARNLMIRAVKARGATKSVDFVELDELLRQWSINPYLMNALASEIEDKRASLGLH